MARASGTERANDPASARRACRRIGGGERLIETGARAIGPSHTVVGVDALRRNAELFERRLLSGEVLLVGRAAGVADGDVSWPECTIKVPLLKESSYHLIETAYHRALSDPRRPVGLSADRSPYGHVSANAASERMGAMSETAQPASLACLSDQQRKEAMARFAVLQPHLEHDVPLSRAAHDAGIATPHCERWLSRFRAEGLVGLARPARSDAGNRKLSVDFASLIEGLALHKPRPSVAAISPGDRENCRREKRRRAVLCDCPRHCSRP